MDKNDVAKTEKELFRDLFPELRELDLLCDEYEIIKFDNSQKASKRRDAISKRMEQLESIIKNDLHKRSYTTFQEKRLEDLRFLWQIMDQRKWGRTEELIHKALKRLKSGEDLPSEWVQFAFERFADAVKIARNTPAARKSPIARAMYLGGREDTVYRHFLLAEEVLKKSYGFRHRKDPIDSAIRKMSFADFGISDKEYVKKIVKVKEYWVLKFLIEETKNKHMLDWYKSRLEKIIASNSETS